MFIRNGSGAGVITEWHLPITESRIHSPMQRRLILPLINSCKIDHCWFKTVCQYQWDLSMKHVHICTHTYTNMCCSQSACTARAIDPPGHRAIGPEGRTCFHAIENRNKNTASLWTLSTRYHFLLITSSCNCSLLRTNKSHRKVSGAWLHSQSS